jgi:hypothetical protein
MQREFHRMENITDSKVSPLSKPAPSTSSYGDIKNAGVVTKVQKKHST